MQLVNERIKYNNKKEKRTQPYNIISPLESRKQIFKKLLSMGKSPVGVLGLDEFLQEEKDIELEHFIEIYMSNLYQKTFEGKPLNLLLAEFNICNFSISEQQAVIVEKNTRSRSDSEYWFKLRLGRITASIFKDVYTSKIAIPINLLKKICYPWTNNIKTKAMEYGKNTEVVLKKLMEENKKTT